MIKAFRIFKKSLLYILILLFFLVSLSVAGVYVFQDKIIQLTFKELNKHLVTKIEIDPRVEVSILKKFPEIFIGLRHVKIHERSEGSSDLLASLQDLNVTFNAFDFLQGRYVINNIYAHSGDIQLKTDNKGRGNYFIFKTDSSSKSNVSLDLKNIVLQDVRISYDHVAQKQHYQAFVKDVISKLKVKEKVWHIALDGDLIIHQIKIGNQEYLKDKVLTIHSEQEYHEEAELFRMAPSILNIQGAEFNLAGFYEARDKNEIDFLLTAKQSTIATLFSFLPQKISEELSIYKSAGNILFEASVKGFIKKNIHPHIHIDFGFNNATFYHPDFDKKIHNATLKGSFSNGTKNNLAASLLRLNDITATFNGRTFTGNFEMENFEDPMLKFNMAGSVDIGSFFKIYPLRGIDQASGNMDINLFFEGKTNDLRTKEGKEKINTVGNISIQNLHLLLKDLPSAYENIQGSFSFNKSDLNINSLSGAIGKSDFTIQGNFKNLITKLFYNQEQMTVDAKIHAQQIYLDDLLRAFSSASSSGKEKENVSLADYKLKIDFDIKNLLYKRFHAKNIKTSLGYHQNIAVIQNTSFNIAGGKINNLHASANFKSPKRIDLNTQASLAGIHIDSIFYVFENFQQDFITDKNLKGQFHGEIQTFLSMDQDMKVDPASVIATIDASILHGELNNFEPMKKLSAFIEEKKLENIQFSELKNKIYIENRKTVIPEMEIKSNVSNITVTGTHTFDQYMDYKLTVPLKNFKRKPRTDKDEAFGAIEEDNRGNSLIFLTIKGHADNYKISYDTKRTGKKIREGLRKEGIEIEQIFKLKKPVSPQEPAENEFFDF